MIIKARSLLCGGGHVTAISVRTGARKRGPARGLMVFHPEITANMWKTRGPAERQETDVAFLPRR